MHSTNDISVIEQSFNDLETCSITLSTLKDNDNTAVLSDYSSHYADCDIQTNKSYKIFLTTLTSMKIQYEKLQWVNFGTCVCLRAR